MKRAIIIDAAVFALGVDKFRFVGSRDSTLGAGSAEKSTTGHNPSARAALDATTRK